MSEQVPEDPGAELAPAAAPPEEAEPYRPWRRPLTYVVFGLGMQAVTFLMFCFGPPGVAFGFVAMGCGIPAVLLANKEIRRHPEAGGHGFIVWGRRTGKIAMIIGPLVSILWIVAFAVLGAASTMRAF